MKYFSVAIDGPAGSGKSSISKIVANKTGFVHIDSGAMYRAITYYALENGIDIYDESKYSFLGKISVGIDKDGKTFLNGNDVTDKIRSEEVTNNVSQVSKVKAVREKLVKLQRLMALKENVIMDGRDIGSVVLPNADIKIFLTASAKERARRRCEENKLKGIESDYETILQEIKVRDYTDSNRDISPLKKADGAIMLDTTDLSIDEVVDKILKLIDEKRASAMDDFKMEDLDLSHKRLRPRDKVIGEVISIQDKTIFLDIKQFTEGTMHLEYYTKDPSVTTFKGLVNIGDKIECEVTKVNEDNIYLSRLNQIKYEVLNDLEKIFEDKTNIVVYVAKENENGKGYIVKYNDFECFMPKSQALPNMKTKTNVEVKIIDFDKDKKKVVVSAKEVEHENYLKKREEELAKINVDDELEGVITKVEKYAAFVKFDNVIGIIRARDVCHEYVDILTVLKAGDTVKVKVLSKENNKLYVSRKALIKTAYQEFKENHNIADVIEAKLTNKLPFGLLLEVAPNLKGLLHSFEYSHNPNDNFANQVVVGDVIKVQIIGFSDEDEKISLSRKSLMDNPWEKVEAKVGDVTKAKIKEVRGAGLIVEAFGVDGFIPQSETMAERGKAIADYYAVGDEVNAIVIEINPKQWKLKLSIKKFEDKEARKEFEQYLNDAEEATTNLGDALEALKK